MNGFANPAAIDSALRIRWMIVDDLPVIEAIETANFEFPWTEDDFYRVNRQQSVVSKVVERDGQIVGYLVYEIHGRTMLILNMAIHTNRQRKGIGRALVEHLKEKLNLQDRVRIRAVVRESNLEAHVFFRACGMRATRIVQGAFDNGELAYEFNFYRHWEKSRTERPELPAAKH
jgi:ribosomal-protein-alanine N-acetyltransferase